MPTAPAKDVARPGPANPRAPLTPRQEAFCQPCLTRPTRTLAAVLAGYSTKNAGFQASRMPTKANVLRRVAARMGQSPFLNGCSAVYAETAFKGYYAERRREPRSIECISTPDWIPAFAGMTRMEGGTPFHSTPQNAY